jgi:hypothetical protein
MDQIDREVGGADVVEIAGDPERRYGAVPIRIGLGECGRGEKEKGDKG